MGHPVVRREALSVVSLRSRAVSRLVLTIECQHAFLSVDGILGYNQLTSANVSLVVVLNRPLAHHSYRSLCIYPGTLRAPHQDGL